MIVYIVQFTTWSTLLSYDDTREYFSLDCDLQSFSQLMIAKKFMAFPSPACISLNSYSDIISECDEPTSNRKPLRILRNITSNIEDQIFFTQISNKKYGVCLLLFDIMKTILILPTFYGFTHL